MCCATSISTIFFPTNKSMNTIPGFMCFLRVAQTTLLRGDEFYDENILNATIISWKLINDNVKWGKPIGCSMTSITFFSAKPPICICVMKNIFQETCIIAYIIWKKDSIFEEKNSVKLSTPSSDVSLDDSSLSIELTILCSKSVSMGTYIEELADSCTREENSSPNPSFAILFNISINTSTPRPLKEVECHIISSKENDKDPSVSPAKS